MFPKGKNTTPPSDAQAKEKLAVYVHEYLVHVGAHKAAAQFLAEIRCDKQFQIGEAPGFLLQWWSVFYDLYSAAPERRESYEHSNEAKAFHDYGFVNSSFPNGLQHGPGHPLGQVLALQGGPDGPMLPNPGLPPGMFPVQGGIPLDGRSFFNSRFLPPGARFPGPGNAAMMSPNFSMLRHPSLLSPRPGGPMHQGLISPHGLPGGMIPPNAAQQGQPPNIPPMSPQQQQQQLPPNHSNTIQQSGGNGPGRPSSRSSISHNGPCTPGGSVQSQMMQSPPDECQMQIDQNGPMQPASGSQMIRMGLGTGMGMMIPGGIPQNHPTHLVAMQQMMAGMPPGSLGMIPRPQVGMGSGSNASSQSSQLLASMMDENLNQRSPAPINPQQNQLQNQISSSQQHQKPSTPGSVPMNMPMMNPGPSSGPGFNGNNMRAVSSPHHFSINNGTTSSMYMPQQGSHSSSVPSGPGDINSQHNFMASNSANGLPGSGSVNDFFPPTPFVGLNHPSTSQPPVSLQSQNINGPFNPGMVSSNTSIPSSVIFQSQQQQQLSQSQVPPYLSQQPPTPTPPSLASSPHHSIQFHSNNGSVPSPSTSAPSMSVSDRDSAAILKIKEQMQEDMKFFEKDFDQPQHEGYVISATQNNDFK